MDKNCEKIQIDILKASNDGSVKKHLQKCQKCADFATFAENAIKVFAEKSPIDLTPPSQLDVKIKKYATEHLKNKSKQIIPFLHRKYLTIITVAASMLLVSAIIFFLKEENANDLRNSQNNRYLNTLEGISNVNTDTNWDELDLEDDFFTLSTEIHISKELIYFSSTDEEYEFEMEPKIEFPNEILI